MVVMVASDEYCACCGDGACTVRLKSRISVISPHIVILVVAVVVAVVVVVVVVVAVKPICPQNMQLHCASVDVYACMCLCVHFGQLPIIDYLETIDALAIVVSAIICACVEVHHTHSLPYAFAHVMLLFEAPC